MSGKRQEWKHHTKAYIESLKHEWTTIKERNMWAECGEVLKLFFNYYRRFFSLYYGRRPGAGDGDYHQLDGSRRLLLDTMTTQMQQFLNRNNEELYRQIEGLEHQMNPNAGRPYGRNKRFNNGPNQIERQDKIEGVKLNVLPFKGRSDPDAYLDWEMKIQHAFSYNDYPEVSSSYILRLCPCLVEEK